MTKRAAARALLSPSPPGRAARLAGWLLACACAANLPSAELPAKARPDAAERPPRLAAAAPWRFSELVRNDTAQLDNGLMLRVLERRALPLIELRLLIASGSASDAERPGVAALSLRALEVMAERALGREPAARAESFGAQLRLQTGRDATLLALTVPSSALREGVELLAALTVNPSWSPAAFEAARARELSRLQALQQSPGWLAEQALYAELFRAPRRQHPYAHADTLPSALQRLTLEDSKSWYEHNVSPRNATLFAVGDVAAAELATLARRAFGGWQGPEVAPLEVVAPPAHRVATTLLVDRAGASSSELRIAALGPARQHADWPAFAVLQRLLGSDDSGRLRRELTRRGELAVELSSSLVPVARGATPLVIAAATSTERTGLALAALLDSLAVLTKEAPHPRELRAAREQLSTSVPLRLETSAGAAELLQQQQLWGLPGEGLDELQRQLARLTNSDLQNAAVEYLSAPPVVVVVGDAARLLTPLSRFGQVHVLDPVEDFRIERVVSQDPTVPLEGPVAPLSPRAEPGSDW